MGPSSRCFIDERLVHVPEASLLKHWPLIQGILRCRFGSDASLMSPSRDLVNESLVHVSEALLVSQGAYSKSFFGET